MANQEHLDILKQGVETWNRWKRENPDIEPDLENADLYGENLNRADLTRANLRRANLSEAEVDLAGLSSANLRESNLTFASLNAANLNRANLGGARLDLADLSIANLRGADLRGADLTRTDLFGADLSVTDLSGAKMMSTILGDVDLRGIRRLDTIDHIGPSTVGIDTIYRSRGNIPENFLRGAGVPDSFIEYMRSLVVKPIDYYTCFISYSSRDHGFAERLYADLQSHGVRCWYAPEDMKIGDKSRQRIDESIRLYDKLLLVLSESSLASTWVAYEVEKALNKEPEGVPNVLFPIRLDKTILTSETDWAKEILRSRHIGDFEHWKNHDAYQRAFQRLLRDLKAEH